jgi:hypothetical protein
MLLVLFAELPIISDTFHLLTARMAMLLWAFFISPKVVQVCCWNFEHSLRCLMRSGMGTSAEKDLHFVSQLHKRLEVRPESLLLPAEVATRKRRTKRTRRMARVETKNNMEILSNELRDLGESATVYSCVSNIQDPSRRQQARVVDQQFVV